MNNLIVKTTALGLKILSDYVSEGDIVVDATAGNGNDTLALAKMVNKTGKVYSFDIQDEAIETTKALLEKEGYRDICCLIKDSHHRMQDYILEKGKLSAVVFNLGYLPRGEKDITTKKETSLDAVKQALDLIKPNGLVLITMYSGHEEGKREKDALLEYASKLPSKGYHVAYFNLINQPNNPPELLLITRK
ncbi:MAG: methyltransferase domain-containing protein [Clostridiales bacterium]|nr:methyltransferase domain-containing protein [Clostridiales bacterium]